MKYNRTERHKRRDMSGKCKWDRGPKKALKTLTVKAFRAKEKKAIQTERYQDLPTKGWQAFDPWIIF